MTTATGFLPSWRKGPRRGGCPCRAGWRKGIRLARSFESAKRLPSFPSLSALMAQRTTMRPRRFLSYVSAINASLTIALASNNRNSAIGARDARTLLRRAHIADTSTRITESYTVTYCIDMVSGYLVTAIRNCHGRGE